MKTCRLFTHPPPPIIRINFCMYTLIVIFNKIVCGLWLDTKSFLYQKSVFSSFWYCMHHHNEN